jgi:hypothetical protein
MNSPPGIEPPSQGLKRSYSESLAIELKALLQIESDSIKENVVKLNNNVN